MANKVYILSFVKFKTKKAAYNGLLEDGNHTCDFMVYNDGTSKENKKDALAKYKAMTKDEMYYSASVSKVIESTDY